MSAVQDTNLTERALSYAPRGSLLTRNQTRRNIYIKAFNRLPLNILMMPHWWPITNNTKEWIVKVSRSMIRYRLYCYLTIYLHCVSTFLNVPIIVLCMNKYFISCVNMSFLYMWEYVLYLHVWICYLFTCVNAYFMYIIYIMWVCTLFACVTIYLICICEYILYLYVWIYILYTWIWILLHVWIYIWFTCVNIYFIKCANVYFSYMYKSVLYLSPLLGRIYAVTNIPNMHGNTYCSYFN
jgi:hypothetical protein